MLFRNLTTTLVTQVTGLLIGIVTSIVINRALMPDGKGLFATYLTSLEVISTFSTFGFNKGVMYHIARTTGDERTQLVDTAIGVALVNALFVCMCTIVLFSSLSGNTFDQLPPSAVLIALVTSAATILSGYFEQILRAYEQVMECNIGTIIRRLTYIVLLLIISSTIGLTLELAMIIYMITVIVLMLYYLQRVSIIGFFPRLHRAYIYRFLSYGLKYQAFSFITVLHQRADVFILGFLVGSTQVGYYSTAVGLAQLLWTLPTALNFVIVPYVANRRTERSRSGEVTAILTRVTLTSLTVVALVIGLFAPQIITLLYGVAYLPSAIPLRIMLPGIVAYSVFHVCASYLIGKGQLMTLTYMSIATLFLNIIINFLSIPVLGPTGAALASSFTYGLSALITIAITSRQTGMPIDSFFLIGAAEISLITRILNIHANKKKIDLL